MSSTVLVLMSTSRGNLSFMVSITCKIMVDGSIMLVRMCVLLSFRQKLFNSKIIQSGIQCRLWQASSSQLLAPPVQESEEEKAEKDEEESEQGPLSVP